MKTCKSKTHCIMTSFFAHIAAAVRFDRIGAAVRAEDRRDEREERS